MKINIWLIMIICLFSCENRIENSELESIHKNEFTIRLDIVDLDTLIFYKSNSYDLCDLKCVLFQDGEDFDKNNHGYSWRFLKAHLIIESSIELSEVYDLIELLQSIGFRTLYYSIKHRESETILYRVPVNFDLIDLVKVGCVTTSEEYDYRTNLRFAPPTFTEFGLPKRYILVVDSIGRYSVNDKTYTKLEYKNYIDHQFRNKKHKIVGLKIDDNIAFDMYFEILGSLYSIVDIIRNEEALFIYKKQYSVLDKEEQKCIRKSIPKNIIDFQIKDNQYRGCGGLINWE